MRQILISLYILSIFFMFWIFYASIIAIDNQMVSKMNMTSDYTPAFSTNLVGEFNIKVFGSIRNMLIIVSSVGIVIQLPILYKLVRLPKKQKVKDLKTAILYAWLGLFSPYISLFLLTLL